MSQLITKLLMDSTKFGKRVYWVRLDLETGEIFPLDKEIFSIYSVKNQVLVFGKYEYFIDLNQWSRTGDLVLLPGALTALSMHIKQNLRT